MPTHSLKYYEDAAQRSNEEKSNATQCVEIGLSWDYEEEESEEDSLRDLILSGDIEDFPDIN